MFIKKSISIFAAMILGLFVLAGFSEAEDSRDEILTGEEAAVKLKEVLDRAVEAYGGREFLAGIENVRVEMTGTWAQINNSYTPDTLTVLKRATKSGYQKSTNNYYFNSSLEDADTSASVVGKNSNYTLAAFEGRGYLTFPETGYAIAGLSIQGWILSTGRIVTLSPHLVVEALNENREKLEWLGEANHGGKSYDLIGFSERIGGYDTFYFEKGTGFLGVIQTPSSDLVLGDIIQKTTFEDYYEKDGTVFHKTRSIYRGDARWMEYTVDLMDLNAELEESDFVPSEPILEALTPEPSHVVKLADNVYSIQGGGNKSLFVEFADYVVVFGVPSDGDTTAEHLVIIRETVGDKTIRYAIPTHHHASHIGGMREYINQGIGIITTSRNLEYFEKVARANAPNNTDPKEPNFEIVDRKMVFDDGQVRVELINIGPIGHAKDMFVAWLPKEKIVFTADVFSFHSSLPTNVGDKYKSLAIENYNTLKKAGIDAETIVQFRGFVRTKAEFEKAIFGEDQD